MVDSDEDEDIPRSAEVKHLADSLASGSAGPRHRHLCGPPGSGKRSMVRALQAEIELRGAIAVEWELAADFGRSATSNVLRTARKLAEGLNVDPPVIDSDLDDPVSAFMATLAALGTAVAPKRLVALLRLDDDLLLAPAGGRFMAALQRSLPPCGLLTWSTFPLELVGRDHGLVIAPVSLRLEPYRYDEDLFADDGDARGDDQDLVDWLLSRQDAPPGVDPLVWRRVAHFAVKAVIQRTSGQPAVTARLLGIIFEEFAALASANPSALRRGNEILHQIEISYNALCGERNWLLQRLLPHIASRNSRHGLSAALLDKLVDAVAYIEEAWRHTPARMPHAAHEPRREIALALGLVRDRSGGDHVDFPVIREALGRDDEARRSWLHETVAWLRRAANAQRDYEQRQRLPDPLLGTVEELVRSHFCESAVGIARGMRLEYSEVVVPGQHYKIALSYMSPEVEERQGRRRGGAPQGGARQQRRSIPGARPIATLQIFPFVDGANRELWISQVAMLRRLTQLNVDVLPVVETGGWIDSSVAFSRPNAATGYLLMTERGDVASAKPERFAEISRNHETSFALAVELAEALTHLHQERMVHRRIRPENLQLWEKNGRTRITLTGFEYARYLTTVLPGSTGDAAGQAQLLDRRDEYQDMFVAPELLEGLRNSMAQVDDLGLSPHADVFSLAVLIAHLLFGPPDEDDVVVFARELKRERNVDGANWTPALRAHARLFARYRRKKYRSGIPAAISMIPPKEAKPLLSALRAAYEEAADLLLFRLIPLGPGYAQPHGAHARILDAMRNIERRSTAEVLLADLRAIVNKLERRRSLIGKPHTLIYNTDAMARELADLGLFVRGTTDAETSALLENQLWGWLDTATELYHAPAGASFVAAAQGPTNAASRHRIAVLCRDVVFFAWFWRDPDRDAEDTTLLRLGYTVPRADARVPRFLRDFERVRFPRPFVLISDLKRSRSRVEDRKDWSAVAERVLSQETRGERSIAIAAWDFHRQCVEAEARAGNMRVLASPAPMRPGGALLRLDTTAFQREIGSDFFLQLVAGGAEAKSYFQARIERWLETNDGLQGGLSFLPVGGRRIPLRVAPEVWEGGSDALVVLGHGVSGSGRLVFNESLGTRIASERQREAIEKVARNERLMRQLQRPSADALITSPPDRRLQGLGETAQIIAHMKDADPLYALQGPPGTGKTTAMAHFVSQMLQDNEGLRILITSQSHAAVDTILSRVTDQLEADLHRLPRPLRLASDRVGSKVAAAVRERHSLDAVTAQVAAEMERSARTHPGDEDNKLLRFARESLHEACTSGFHDVSGRLGRTASVVICTTGSAHEAEKLLAPPRARYDVVIVDEAAKAWAIDLVQPLAIAERAVLVGDHRQLPPYDPQSVERMFDRARALRQSRNARYPAEVAEIVDDSNFEEAKRWLNPFRRIFELYESGVWSAPLQTRRAIEATMPVVERLERQFRSVPAIGNLISECFYSGKLSGTRGPSLFVPLLWPTLSTVARPLIWFDTSGEPEFSQDQDGHSRTNEGEAKVIANLVQRYVQSHEDYGRMLRQAGHEKYIEPHEYIKIMSPYAAQVRSLVAKLQGHHKKLGIESEQGMDRVVQTIDSAQGAEAELVIVSMARSVSVMLPPRGASELDVLRAINQHFGFLRSPERVNVMLSRARTQLVIVGDFDLFESFGEFLEMWKDCYGADEAVRDRLERTYGFWRSLTNHFLEHRIPVGELR